MLGINKTYRPCWKSDSRYRVLVGGAGSGKSVNVAQRLIDTAGTHENARVLTVRKVAKTCRHSTFQLYKDVLNETNRRSEVSIREQPMEIHFDGGGSILHAGLDDEQKLKSISGITHIWVEEATELDFPDQDDEEADLAQLDLRLRGVPKRLDPNITLSFNPVKDAGDIYEHLGISAEDVPHRDWAEVNGVYVQHTTQADNPWVGEDYMEAFKRLDGSMRKIYVEGKMARSDDPDQVIPYKYVQQGKDLEPEGGTQTLGVDVARFGSDDTVLCRVEGNAAVDFDSHSGLDTSRIATVVQNAVNDHGIQWPNAGVDAVGIGAGVVDQLPGGVPVKAGSSPKPYQEGNSQYDFYNLRSQLWWVLREALKDYRLALPNPPADLVEDLCAPRYDFRGKKMEVRVEPKEDIKSRLGRSPDYADALGIGWALTELMLSTSRTAGGASIPL
jgi:hypothetical protein